MGIHEKILVIDDEPNVVAAIKRQLHPAFDVDAVLSGEEGLNHIAANGPFAVVVSDLRMPGMDGIRFLIRVKEVAPETVRILLTGYADMQTAIDSVNEGNVFRFLTKPCPPDTLFRVLQAALDQYRLIVSERELLEKTLSGSIKVLAEVLSMVNPTAFGRATRVRRLARWVGLRLKIDNLWEVEVAALLSQIGCVTVPEPVLHKSFLGHSLSVDEFHMLEAHPQVGHDLLVNIPRLDHVARMIAAQNTRFDLSKEALPLGARVLKVVLDYDDMASHNVPWQEALARLQQQWGMYDPAVLKALGDALIQQEVGDRYLLKEVAVKDLVLNMIFADDVVSTKGVLVITKGQEVSVPIILRLRNFVSNAVIKEPLRVLVAAPPKSAG